MFNWDYWQVEALPNSYIEEIFARLQAENDLKERENRNAEIIAKMKAANRATLGKMGLSA